MVLINGGLWSAGNGLTSGAVVYYLAFEMGASGSDIGWILAAPAMAGLLRMFSPAVIRCFGSARRACLLAWLAAYVVAWGLPLLAMPVVRPTPPAWGMALLIGVLAAHQLLEYVGVVGFWAWMAELVPRRVRGRYFARRTRWQLAALIPTLLLSGWFIDTWKTHFTEQGDVGWGYAIATSVGAALLLASLWPLKRIPSRTSTDKLSSAAAEATDATTSSSQSDTPDKGSWRMPFGDGAFLRLLAFGCFVAFANGVTQSAQSFANKSYGISLAALAAMRISMLLGQFGVSGPIGRFSDRWGNRPVLILAQVTVALGPLFYLLASPAQPWWIWGAWLAWSAFAGLNICLPNLMLKMAPGQSKSAYIATYFAVSGAIYALSTIAGGYLFDTLRELELASRLATGLNAERILFLAGWVLRSLSAVLLLFLIEPGAIRWTSWLKQRLFSEKAARRLG